MNIVFFTLIFLVLWAYIVYPFFLKVLLLLGVRRRVEIKEKTENLSVTLVIAAHNEENVIKEKLENTLKLDYPKDKLRIVVASDFSTDKTNDIVQDYKKQGVNLYITKERKGKINAYNEVCETISTDIIAFSDANSMWHPKALRYLADSFKDEKVGYVSGKLQYINTDSNNTAQSEGAYWRYELLLRKLESDLKSITAGNGAIYAVRGSIYEPINILYNHDFEFPSMSVKKGYSSVYNESAIAYEKAGETNTDEYKRKVRMLGRTWHKVLHNFSIFSPFKVGLLYSIFMLSHRLLRYLTGILQILIFIFNIFLIGDSAIYVYIFLLQLIFYIFSILGYYFNKNKIFYICYYFNLFQIATIVGFYNAITNKVKPFWGSPQTTRYV